MSLHDILMDRALIQFQTDLGGKYSGIGPSKNGGLLDVLSAGVLKSIEDKKQEKLAQEQSGILEKAKNDNKSKITTKITAGEPTSYTIESGDNADDLKVKREQRLTDQTALRNTTTLRQEFINRPEVKDYVVTSTNVKAMEGLLNSALSTGDKNNLVATDQGLITMYNKLTDPASVVRESEYARTPQNLPMVSRIYGAIAKLQQGGAGLTNEDRQALVEGAKIIMKERGNQYNNTLKDYTDLSASYGLDTNMVTRGMTPFEQDNFIPNIDLEKIDVRTTKSGNKAKRIQ
jgi:hypothetical protein